MMRGSLKILTIKQRSIIKCYRVASTTAIPRLFFLIAIVCLSMLVALSTAFAAAAPDLEERTRQLSAELRCVVCQNLSVADSPSEMAQQMRAVVREQLAAGKTPEQVKEFFVSKYGEWVLLKPRTSGFAALLWILPYVALTIGLIVAILLIRSWSKRKALRIASHATSSAAIDSYRGQLLTDSLEEPDLEDKSPHAELLRQRLTLRIELQELEFDFQAGKISEDDYQELRQQIESKDHTVLQAFATQPAKTSNKAEATKKTQDGAKKDTLPVAKWRLVAGGAFLLVFGLVLGLTLTQSVRPRTSENDSMTGDFMTGTTTAPNVQNALAEGKTAFANQEFAKAIEAFKSVLATDPNQPEAHAYMGFILVHAGHGDGALLAFDKALQQVPNFPMALWGKGLVLYREKQDFPAARATLEKLFNLMPAGEQRNEVQKILAEIPAGDGNVTTKPAASPSPAGPNISGIITIDDKLKQHVSPDAVLFIIARAANGGGGPPLAVKKIDKPKFPLSFSLGQENVMIQGLPFNGKVNISVRLDKDGNPTTRAAGDLTGEYKKNPAEVGGKNIDIALDRIAP